MAHIRFQPQQPLNLSIQVGGMALSQSLMEHLRSLDLLIDQLLHPAQWVIIYNQLNPHCLTYSSDPLFGEFCLEICQSSDLSGKNPLIIPLEVANNQLSPIFQQFLNERRYTNLILIPLIDNQTDLGTFCLAHPQKEVNLSLIQAIAHQASLILHKEIQNHPSYPQSPEETLLRGLYQAFNSQSSKICPWERMLSAIGQYFCVEQVILLRFSGDQVIIEHEWGLNSDITPWQVVDLIKASCEVKTYQYTSTFTHNPPNTLVSVSLRTQDHCFGCLILQTFEPYRQFSVKDLHFLELIGDIIANFKIYKVFEQELGQINHKNQAKGEFLSYMTHELRTPISGILGFARMLDKEIYGELNKKQKEYVKGIVSSGEHLLSLVNDFLDFSKLEAKKEELVCEPMVVEELCQSVLAIVQSKATEQGLNLILEVDEKVDICVADQRRMKQILLNLLSNALKFTEQGTVTLKVIRDQDTLLFSVIDTGIGIKTENLTILFEPYQQIKSSVGQKHKGTGLGLTISRSLAQLHGGDLTVISEVGKGSCFTLILPQKSESI